MTVPTEDSTKSLAQAEIDALLQRNTDRPSGQRYPYKAVQQVTPYCEGILGDTLAVDCYDISRGGLAFIAEHSPLFEEFLIELKQGAFHVAVRARVMDTQPTPEKKLLVRCEFIEKVELSRLGIKPPTIV